MLRDDILSNELKECHFCGGDAIIHIAYYIAEFTRNPEEVPGDAQIVLERRFPGKSDWITEYRRKGYVPQCRDSSCIGRSQKMFRTKQDAIEAWSRRANDV